MIVNIDNENRVVYYNTELNKQESQQYLDDSTYYIENIAIPQPQYKEGKEAILCFPKEQSQFYYEYIDVMPQPPSDTEMMMQNMAELELQNLEAQQERQLLAQQISDLELAMLERNEENV